MGCDRLVCRLGPGWWKMVAEAVTFFVLHAVSLPPTGFLACPYGHDRVLREHRSHKAR